MRVVVGLLLAGAVAGGAWILTLPTKEQCRASGRVVDPTERHCESGDGWVQLREHALFHTREPILGAVLLLGITWGVQRLRRRKRSETSATNG